MSVRDRIKEFRRLNQRLHPRRSDIEGRLYATMRSAMFKWLRAGGVTSNSLGRGMLEFVLGYSMCELRGHIEGQFTGSMTWETWGEWEIDHTMPKSWCVVGTAGDEGFRRCWDLGNLKPMRATENRAKGARYAG